MLTDPVSAIFESEKLNAQAATCNSITNDINVILEELPAMWEGVSANIFTQNNRQLIEMLNVISRELIQVSADMKEIVTRM